MAAPRGREEARFRHEFVAEAEEILEQAARGLVSLEASGDDAHPDVVNAFFRAIHSLKGLAAMVGLTAFADTAHEFEALLDGVRMGRVRLDAPTLAAARAGLDALTGLARRVAGGEVNPAPAAAVLAAFTQATEPRAKEPTLPPATPTALPPEMERVLTDYERHRIDDNERKGRQILLLPLELSLETFDDGLRAGMAEAGKLGELIGTFPGPPAEPSAMNFVLLVAAPPELDPAEAAARCGARTFDRISGGSPPSPPVRPPAPGGPSQPLAARPLAEEAPPLPALGGTVRVALEKINGLLDLTGELALARNALRGPLDRALRSSSDRAGRHEAQKAFAQMDRAVTALARAALATRLVPVEQLTAKLARATTSIAQGLGKEAALEVIGGETELDKVLADELSEPLLHMLRNALDHGIETRAERLAAGKPPSGRIALGAEARGRDVVITLADDGRGMEPERLVRSAREKGILADGAPPPDDPLELVFRPGFSTAAAVSALSGRGVGLDVVRSKIVALKGSVSVRSAPGAGTVFEVIVPITLALVESLLVRSGRRFFAFPTAGVVRTLGLSPERLIPQGGRQAIVDEDGSTLPLTPLSRLLGLPSEEGGSGGCVVVAEQGSRRAGFIVETIEGMQDLIIKPLSGQIARAPEITGAAELPDGELALTLDTGLLLERAARGEAA